MTVIDDDDLASPLSSNSATPSPVDLENADLGISSYEYPNAGLLFDIGMKCLSSSYKTVGGFLVRKEFVSLYTKIWRKYGHIATRNVIRHCSSALVTAVNCLLPMIAEMEDVSIRNVAESSLEKWENMISTCESMEFNVSWLRQRLDIIKVDRAGILVNVVPAAKAILEEEKALAAESEKVEQAIQSLKARTEKYQARLKMMLSRDYNLLDDLF